MAFNDAIELLDEYRTERIKALSNEQAMQWSTTPSGSYSGLLTEFNRDDENGEWSELYGDPNGLTDDHVSVGLKIAWLCGCYRCLRMQFAAGTDDRQRSRHDHTRFELLRLKFYQTLLDGFKKIVKGFAGE